MVRTKVRHIYRHKQILCDNSSEVSVEPHELNTKLKSDAKQLQIDAIEKII